MTPAEDRGNAILSTLAPVGTGLVRYRARRSGW